MPKALVLKPDQKIGWVLVDNALIAKLRSGHNIQRLKTTMAKHYVAWDQLSDLKAGFGIPCECGCNKLVTKGEMVIQVSSSLSDDGKTNHYFSSVECERKGLNNIAQWMKRYGMPGSKTIQFTEKEI